MTIVEWCRDHDVWYLKIDIEIPEICIQEAQAVYDEGFFVEHRGSDGNGWCSTALHGFVPEGEDISMVGIIPWDQKVMDLQKRVWSGVGQK